MFILFRLFHRVLSITEPDFFMVRYSYTLCETGGICNVKTKCISFYEKPFPNSHKVYVQGSREDLKVPMREIHQSPTTGSFGEEENSPVRVYDTSGVYTDPCYEINLQKGLPALREKWIAERNDVETYQGRTVQPQDNGYYDGDPRDQYERFITNRLPLRAKKIKM